MIGGDGDGDDDKAVGHGEYLLSVMIINMNDVVVNDVVEDIGIE